MSSLQIFACVLYIFSYIFFMTGGPFMKGKTRRVIRGIAGWLCALTGIPIAMWLLFTAH